jgi:hypothetical protein
LKSDELGLGYGGDDLANRFRSSDKKRPNEDWNANGEGDVGHLLAKGGAKNPFPSEEQSQGKPTEENETERCNDANDIDSGLTEGEQGASYAEQEKECDNDISTDNEDGKKPEL